MSEPVTPCTCITAHDRMVCIGWCRRPVRKKCRHCIHDEHSGMCNGRNGGTAYPCPCHHDAERTP